MQLNRDPSILIRLSKEETRIVSVFVNNFFLTSNIMVIIDALKESLTKKYDTKDLGKVKTIIGW